MVCRLLLETGRGAAWLAHLLWEQRVAGSNPVAPTKKNSREFPKDSRLFCVWKGDRSRTCEQAGVDAVFSGTDVPPGKHEEGEAILSPRPKRISCELPKGSQLFYASIATAARALCCRGLAAFDFGPGALH